MKTETPNKQPVQNTMLTLKKCAEDPEYRKAYEIILRDAKYRLKNHFYDD